MIKSNGQQTLLVAGLNIAILDPEARLTEYKSEDPYFRMFQVIFLKNELVSMLRITHISDNIIPDIAIDVSLQLDSWILAGKYRQIESTDPLSKVLAERIPFENVAFYVTDAPDGPYFSVSVLGHESAALIEVVPMAASRDLLTLTKELERSLLFKRDSSSVSG